MRSKEETAQQLRVAAEIIEQDLKWIGRRTTETGAQQEVGSIIEKSPFWVGPMIAIELGYTIEIVESEPVKPSSERPIVDSFSGGNEALRASIAALIRLSDAGACVPHGLNGFGRDLLSSAYHRLPEYQTPQQVELWQALRDLHIYTRTRCAGYRNALSEAEDTLYCRIAGLIEKAGSE